MTPKKVLLATVASVMLFFSGCPAQFMKDVNGDGEIRIVVIGDSNTLWSDDLGWYGWPWHFEAMVKLAYPNGPFKVIVRALGLTTISPSLTGWPYDFSILLGISDNHNDQGDIYVFAGGGNDAILSRDPIVVADEMQRLVEEINSRPGSPAALVATVHTFGEGSIHREIRNAYVEAYNDLFPDTVSEPKYIVDFWSATVDGSHHLPDGIHLNLVGQCWRASQMFRKMFPGEDVPSTEFCP